MPTLTIEDISTKALLDYLTGTASPLNYDPTPAEVATELLAREITEETDVNKGGTRPQRPLNP